MMDDVQTSRGIPLERLQHGTVMFALSFVGAPLPVLAIRVVGHPLRVISWVGFREELDRRGNSEIGENGKIRRVF